MNIWQYNTSFVSFLPLSSSIFYLFPSPPTRPQFVMDVDSREEYFMELILSRHARKLLTARCLQDLGRFAAHLDFNLHNWLTRER